MKFWHKVLAKLGHGLGLPSRYSLVRQLGKGAEGEVWLAVDTVTCTWVAVKLIPRGAAAWRLEMVQREFRTLLLLGAGCCPVHITKPLELVLTSKHLALITEYVAGGTLADLIGHRMDEPTAAYYFRQVASALAHCHAAKVVYRDMKPANVLSSGHCPPVLKLCDFGLADSWAERPGPFFNSLVGTPGYMSPEIMASFFAGAASLARRTQSVAAAAAAAAAAVAASHAAAQQPQQQPQQPQQDVRRPSAAGSCSSAAGGGMDAAAPPAAGQAAAGGPSCSSASSAVTAQAAGCGMVRSASGARLNRIASGLVRKVAAATGGSTAARAAAARAAAAAAAAAGDGVDVDLAAYDGVAADVYSLGVMLVVMLLRVMPWQYDMYAASMTPLEAMKRLYRVAVVKGVPWRDATPGSARLSPAALQLLDGMLAADPGRRASLQQVLDSEWVNQDLPPKLQAALAQQDEQQAARVAAAAALCDLDGRPDPAHDAELRAALLAQLEGMFAAAEHVDKGFQLQSRIILGPKGMRFMRQQLEQQQLLQVPGQQQRVADEVVVSPQQQLLHAPDKQQPQQQQQQRLLEEQGHDRLRCSGDASSEEACFASIVTVHGGGGGGGSPTAKAAAGDAAAADTAACADAGAHHSAAAAVV